MCTTITGQVWGIDYIIGQPTVSKFGKQINTIMFICNCFWDLPALQNLNVVEAENQYALILEYAVHYYDIKKYEKWSMRSILYQCVSERSSLISLYDRTLLICSIFSQLYLGFESNFHFFTCSILGIRDNLRIKLPDN